MKAYTLLILTFFTCQTWAATADIPKISCAEFFEQVNELSGSPGMADPFDEAMKVESPSIDVIDTLPGRHGGQLFKVKKRDGLNWGSANTTVGYDPQGDPRWIIEVLGPKAAKYFGFEVLDGSHMLVPDHKEFNTALEKVNAELFRSGLEPIPLTFYSTGNDDNVKAKDYVQRFVDEFGIPIAASGNHLFHDLSFHTSAIVLPKKMLQYKTAMIQFHLDFFEHYKQQHKDSPENIQKAINFYEFLTNLESTTDVDNMTGLTGPLFIDYLKRVQDAEVQMPEIYMIRMVYYGYPGDTSPAGYFSEFMHQPRIADRHRVERVKIHWMNHSPERVASAIHEFAKTYRSPILPDFRADRPLHDSMQEFEKFVEKLCSEITAQRKSIIEATYRLID